MFPSIAEQFEQPSLRGLPQSPKEFSQNKLANHFTKVLLDYLVVVPILILIAPLMAFLALLVRLDSPGPILYRRQVLGRNGRVFNALKFRTMYCNGHEILKQHPQLQAELAQNHKLKKDPRITRIGAFLRRFSLDELPQLFNILRQDMSLVGPRIITPDELALFGEYAQVRLVAMPGLTGWWQVNGRADTTYEERIHLDMYYIQHWSIWLDIKIIFLTIPAVLKGTGAY